jgi:hypothetical protein
VIDKHNGAAKYYMGHQNRVHQPAFIIPLSSIRQEGMTALHGL